MHDTAQPLLTERFDRALLLAHEYHHTDVRKGTKTPYISHLLIVSGTVLEHGGSEDEAIAALLHDAVEDARSEKERRRRIAEIRAEFGQNVLQIVKGCTDTLAARRTKKNSAQRALAHVKHLRKRSASKSVLLVSCADKLHNARAILSDYRDQGERLWGRFNKGREGTLRYYWELVDCLRDRVPVQLFADFAATVAELLARATAAPQRARETLKSR